MKTLKNWWFALLAMIVIILDNGFDVLNPFLVEIGLPDKYIGYAKVIFGLYGIYKTKKELPTLNYFRLREKAEELK